MHCGRRARAGYNVGVLALVRSRAWWLAAVLALACDGGLRLVVVERGELGATAGGGGAEAKAGTSSVLPQGGAVTQGGSGQSSVGGVGGGAGDEGEPLSMAGAAGAPDVPYW